MRSGLFLATGVFVGLIGLVLLVSPGSYLSLYAVNYTSEMDFAAIRFAPVLIGLGVLLIVARDLTDLRFLRVMCLLSAAVFLAVAATGIAAWLTGTAKSSILIASVIEVVLAGLFAFSAARTDDAA